MIVGWMRDNYWILCEIRMKRIERNELDDTFYNFA